MVLTYGRLKTSISKMIWFTTVPCCVSCLVSSQVTVLLHVILLETNVNTSCTWSDSFSIRVRCQASDCYAKECYNYLVAVVLGICDSSPCNLPKSWMRPYAWTSESSAKTGKAFPCWSFPRLSPSFTFPTHNLPQKSHLIHVKLSWVSFPTRI